MANGNEIYAGFWIRAVALFIDGIIFMIPVMLGSYMFFPLAMDPTAASANPQIVMANLFFQTFCSFLYFGVLQAYLRASPGKLIVGLKIMSENLAPASFGQCIGRFFATWVSSLVFMLGYLWVAFSDKKRGWHDMMAGTVVVRSRYMAKEVRHPEQLKRVA